ELVETQASFTAKQRLIMEGAFDISERTLDEVLRPRPDVFVLDADEPVANALQELAASGHSRAPVAHDGKLDEVVGMVHLRDLLGPGDRPVREVAGELAAFPETTGALDVLHEMQVRRLQLALVVDEHGAAAGIVTVEDLLEELVGEIYDETDRDVVGVRREPDGSLVLPGRFPVHDLEDVGVHGMPEGPYATVAGLVLDVLGRVPQAPGDRVTVAGRTIEVLAVDGRAITEVRIGPPPPPASTTGDPVLSTRPQAEAASRLPAKGG
ncbi:MAG TPA: CBS domain-containing protein, partial [Acidimicrobiales bacterium]